MLCTHMFSCFPRNVVQSASVGYNWTIRSYVCPNMPKCIQNIVQGHSVFCRLQIQVHRNCARWTIEMGRIPDYTIRPKPNSWPLPPNIRPNFGRILPLLQKKFGSRDCKVIFRLSHIRSVVLDFHSGGPRIHSVCYNNLIETGKLERKRCLVWIIQCN